MLTGPLVRVKFSRNRVVACYADARAAQNLELADQLLRLFDAAVGQTREEIEQEIKDAWGDDPGHFLLRGLVKIVEDLCEFAGVPEPPPPEVRQSLFRRAALLRAEGRFDRGAIVAETAREFAATEEQIEDQLFADLKGEQRLTKVEPLTPERLLARYNVGLAQGILLKATAVRIALTDEAPARLRRLFTQVKFRRLVCEIADSPPGECRLQLDGPLSLFSATQKYGVQLAMFLPSVLHSPSFDLEADLLWGAAKTPKQFHLGSADGLSADRTEAGTYVPPEAAMFAELFRKKIADWELRDETEIVPLGSSFWVPDYQLVHRRSGRSVGFEILGAWRKSGAQAHLERLSKSVPGRFLVAVSEAHRFDEGSLEEQPGVVRFRQFPLPAEVAARAAQLLGVD